jgi:glutathione S-transferase kappa 1
MKATGNQPPANVPAKGTYMLQDLARSTKYFEIPSLKLPSNFPINTLATQRVLTAIEEEAPKYTAKVSRALWLSYWTKDEDISQPDVIVNCCKAAGLDQNAAVHFISKSKTDAIKQKLLDTTQEAVKLGAFGAPTIVVSSSSTSPQMYFGRFVKNNFQFSRIIFLLLSS